MELRGDRNGVNVVLPEHPPRYTAQPQSPFYTQPIILNHTGTLPQFQPGIQYIGGGVQQYPSNIPFNQNVSSTPHSGTNETNLKHPKLHRNIGIFFIVIGIITCIIDPLVPAVIRYLYSIFISGVFLVISGATSLVGSKKMNKCYLVASLVFDILASLNLLGGLIAGIVVIDGVYSSYGKITYYFSYIPSIYQFRAFAIFNLLYCGFLFLAVTYDAVLKSQEVCFCANEQQTEPRRVLYNIQPYPQQH